MIRRIGLLGLLLLLSWAGQPMAASLDCSDAGKRLWSRSDPQVNLSHIFCGEIGRNGDPKGFHSRAVALPTGAVDRVEDGRHHGGETYDGTVIYSNGRRKRSTFYPDDCSAEAILRSVLYAYRNQTGDHPAWGVLGPSAPEGAASDGGGQGDGYCRDARGRPFEIRIGTIRRRGQDAINTAFPN
ncbi:MAG: EndoU domain-containing protein [Inquilinus limosus]|uniref:EndoU domain-containing protein n=1 Tax=Inquilinus limosus TaxID=171674 RepID=A0A952KEN6_9PROT|nr:EndoU domain-containing protein [Inquilinus limosus]